MYEYSMQKYRKTFNITCTLLDNRLVDSSDVVGATTSSFSTQYLTSMDWAKTTARRDKKHLKSVLLCLILEIWLMFIIWTCVTYITFASQKGEVVSHPRHLHWFYNNSFKLTGGTTFYVRIISPMLPCMWWRHNGMQQAPIDFLQEQFMTS